MNDLYRRCPDCDGVGSISVMSSDPGMHETEYECERCRFTKGYVKVEPTDSIEWCFTHEEELGTYLSICDSEWRRNERRIRMGEDVLQNCDIGDALLVRAREDTA